MMEDFLFSRKVNVRINPGNVNVSNSPQYLMLLSQCTIYVGWSPGIVLTISTLSSSDHVVNSYDLIDE